jgi:hypothetical protein
MKRPSVFVGLAFVMLAACGRNATAPSVPLTADTIQFVGSNPAPGGTIAISGSDFRGFHLSGFKLDLSVLVRQGGDSLNMNVALLNAQGQQCFSGSTFLRSVVAGQATPVTIDVFGFGPTSLSNACPSPVQRPQFDTTTLDVTLESSEAKAILHELLPVRYTFNATLSQVVTTPEIVGLRYASPYSGYPDEFQCDVRDADGDALTITVAVQDEQGRCRPEQHQCWSKTVSFPPRPIDEVAAFAYAFKPDPPTRGTMVCTAVDAHGHVTTRSACFTMDGQPPCP